MQKIKELIRELVAELQATGLPFDDVKIENDGYIIEIKNVHQKNLPRQRRAEVPHVIRRRQNCPF